MVRALTKTNIPFMKYRGLFFGVSMVLTAISAFLLLTRGLNYGTDFTGGLKLLYQFKTPITEGKLTEVLSQVKVKGVVQKFGTDAENLFVVKSDYPEGLKGDFAKPFNEVLDKEVGAGQYSLQKEEYVGAKVGKELRTKGVLAVVYAWIIMLVYIGFRFDFYFGFGAIMSPIHVVIIALGVFALTGREVNLTVIAAILTIIGYSINDTIVIFDRIREDLQKHKGMELVPLVNQSINSTLVRTLITSVCVLFVSLVLFFRAEGDIQSFGLVMIIGVITGTYSSIFIASPVFIFLKQHGHWLGLGKKAPA